MEELKNLLLRILHSIGEIKTVQRPMWTELKELSDAAIRNKDPRWPR